MNPDFIKYTDDVYKALAKELKIEDLPTNYQRFYIGDLSKLLNYSFTVNPSVDSITRFIINEYRYN